MVLIKGRKHIFYGLLLLFSIIPVGFFSKIYSGFGYEFVNNKLGGVFYEIFWCLLAFLIFYRAKPIRIAVWVFIVTCALEFTQLFDTNFLQLIRSNFFGRTLIGSSFAWTDFIYYAIGSALGYFILSYLKRLK